MADQFFRFKEPFLPQAVEEVISFAGGTKHVTSDGCLLQLPWSRELRFPVLRRILNREFGDRWQFIGPTPVRTSPFLHNWRLGIMPWNLS